MKSKYKCVECGLMEAESWPAHYKRVVRAQFEKPFYCRSCKRDIIRAKKPKPHYTQDERIKEMIKKGKYQSTGELMRKEHLTQEYADKLFDEVFEE